jgi:predicted nucleic acid-binding protein
VAVYLDSSALVKLVVTEPESEALRRFLKRRPERVASALARVEVLRAVRAHGELAIKRAVRVLARVRLLRVDDGVLEAAASLDPRVLRSLDAIHIASARELGGDLESLITYDRRMSEATAMLGMPVRAPGTAVDRATPRGRRRRQGSP